MAKKIIQACLKYTILIYPNLVNHETLHSLSCKSMTCWTSLTVLEYLFLDQNYQRKRQNSICSENICKLLTIFGVIIPDKIVILIPIYVMSLYV